MSTPHVMGHAIICNIFLRRSCSIHLCSRPTIKTFCSCWCYINYPPRRLAAYALLFAAKGYFWRILSLNLHVHATHWAVRKGLHISSFAAVAALTGHNSRLWSRRQVSC